MRHATMLVAILAFVPLTSVMAQEPPPIKVGDRVRVTAPDLGSRVATRDDTLKFQRGRGPGLEVVPVMAVAGAMVGAGGILAARLFYLGFLVVGPCGDGLCEEDASRAFAHFPKYESIGATIGVGAGFVLGVVLYSLGQRRQGGAGGKQRRVSATVASQRDGRLGLGASVRF